MSILCRNRRLGRHANKLGNKELLHDLSNNRRVPNFIRDRILIDGSIPNSHVPVSDYTT